MRGALLVAGATSDAGKTVITAGICRWLHRQGVAVAPFKAQNMSLNSGVTPDGREIARAQMLQAAAAGIPPEAVMNPVLLKPSSDRRSQLLVLGRAQPSNGAALEAVDYQARKASLLPAVLAAFEELRRRFDVVICEGAGGIAEINLREGDLANLGLAQGAGLPVLVVCDIDRGGVFASAFGSLALLGPADQSRVHGFLINRFRGDPALLDPGIAELRARTGRPVIGVIPWIDDLARPLDAEDSLALANVSPAAAGDLGAEPGAEPEGGALDVAVIRFPRISNFTDLDPLVTEPGIRVRYATSATAVSAADLVVLPGTKATVADLAWLRVRRLDGALRARARAGGPILGICGGYQMLGQRIDDGIESRQGEIAGLGLLPVTTVFAQDKVLARPAGSAPAFGGAPVCGYEIHHGQVARTAAEPLFETGGGDGEGCRFGTALGTSWHGVLECDGFRRALLSWVAATRGRDWRPGKRPFAAIREARLDALGDLIEAHLDTAALARLIEGGGGAGLPTVETHLVGGREDQPC